MREWVYCGFVYDDVSTCQQTPLGQSGDLSSQFLHSFLHSLFELNIASSAIQKDRRTSTSCTGKASARVGSAMLLLTWNFRKTVATLMNILPGTASCRTCPRRQTATMIPSSPSMERQAVSASPGATPVDGLSQTARHSHFATQHPLLLPWICPGISSM